MMARAMVQYVFLFILLVATSVSSVEVDEFFTVLGSTGEDNIYPHNRMIAEAVDGNGYVVAGYSKSYGYGSFSRVVISRVDSNGLHIESVSYGTASSYDNPTTFKRSYNPPGYLLVMPSSCCAASFGASDAQVVHFDANLDVTFARDYGSNANDVIYCVEPTTLSPGYVMSGHSLAFGDPNYGCLIIKAAQDGSVEWDTLIGGAGSEVCWNVFEDASGAFVAAGATTTFDASGDGALYRLNSDGTIDFVKGYNGIGAVSFQNVLESTQESGIHYLLVGYSLAWTAGGEDALVVLVDSLGDVVFARSYGLGGNEQVQQAIEASAGGYYLAAKSTSTGIGGTSMVIAKIDAVGDLIFAKTNEDSANNDYLSGLMESNGKLVGCGTFASASSSADYVVFRTSLDDPGTESCWASDAVSFPSVDRTVALQAATFDTGLVNVVGTIGTNDFTGTLAATKAIVVPTVTHPCIAATTSPSQTLSPTMTPSMTPSQSQTPSQTSSQTRSASQTASQTASETASTSPSQTASQTSSTSHSASASSIVLLPYCDAGNHHCAPLAECVLTDLSYYCKCPPLILGRYCNSTFTGGSADKENCVGCETLFFCTEDYDERGMQAFVASIPLLMARAWCDCSSPSLDMYSRFSVVQYTVDPDTNELCVEMVVFPSNNPGDAGATDIAEVLVTDTDITEIFTTVTEDRLVFMPIKSGNTAETTESKDTLGLTEMLLIALGSALFLIFLFLGFRMMQKRVRNQYSARETGANSSSKVAPSDTLAPPAYEGNGLIVHMDMDAPEKEMDHQPEEAEEEKDDIGMPPQQERRRTILPDMEDMNDEVLPSHEAFEEF